MTYITFPDEDHVVSMFEEHSSTNFIPYATQCDHQAVLDIITMKRFLLLLASGMATPREN